MKVIGVDTDARAAFCVADFDKRDFKFYNLPVVYTGKNRRRVDPVALYEMVYTILEHNDDIRIINFEEQVGRPGQSSSATFTFGNTFGTIIATFKCAMSATNMYGKMSQKYTPAKVWKRYFNLPKDKKFAVAKAHKVIEGLGGVIVNGKKKQKLTITQAESLLIALYAYETKDLK